MALEEIKAAKERINGRSISTAGFGIDGGRAQMVVKVESDKLENATYQCLGNAVPSGVGINRTLPIAHPQYPWMFCERISSIDGIQFKEKLGPNDTINGLPVQLEGDTLSNYARYDTYELTLEFLPRPYALLKDNQLSDELTAWWDITDTLILPQIFGNKTEYWRFTELKEVPAGEYLTAQQGMFQFRMDSNPSGLNLKDQAVGMGQLRLFVNSRGIQFIWHQVPYSFVLSGNSYFDRYSGRVNQFDWYGFPKGTLLLTSVDVLRVYTPPFPEFVPFNGSYFPSQAKLCDLQFNMIFKNPPIGQPYTYNPLTDNPNNVAAGHNLVPSSLTGKYYYATNQQTGLAIYPSVPFNLFFRNPDA